MHGIYIYIILYIIYINLYQSYLRRCIILGIWQNTVDLINYSRPPEFSMEIGLKVPWKPVKHHFIRNNHHLHPFVIMYPEKTGKHGGLSLFFINQPVKKTACAGQFFLRTLLPSDQWLILLRHERGMETKGVRKHQPVTFPKSQIFWCITHMLSNFALLINLPPFSIGDIPHIQQLGYLITGCQVAKQDAVKDLDGTDGRWLWLDVLDQFACDGYPLVNLQKTMENHHF